MRPSQPLCVLIALVLRFLPAYLETLFLYMPGCATRWRHFITVVSERDGDLRAWSESSYTVSIIFFCSYTGCSAKSKHTKLWVRGMYRWKAQDLHLYLYIYIYKTTLVCFYISSYSVLVFEERLAALYQCSPALIAWGLISAKDLTPSHWVSVLKEAGSVEL